MASRTQEQRLINSHKPGIRHAARDVKFWQSQLAMWERRLQHAMSPSAYKQEKDWVRESKQFECRLHIASFKVSLANAEALLAKREQELADALAQLKRGK